MRSSLLLLLMPLLWHSALQQKQQQNQQQYFVDFFISAPLPQRALVLENASSTLISVLKYTPEDGHDFFLLTHDLTQGRLYIQLAGNVSAVQSRTYLLRLSNDLHVTVRLLDFTFRQSNISVEYMFKLSSIHDKYGLVKSSMLANSVVAIVKVASSSQTLRLLDEDTNGNAVLFHVKEFLPKHYMIRLSRDANLFKQRHLEAIHVETSAGVSLEFRRVIEDERLDIALADETVSGNVSVYEDTRGYVHSLRYEALDDMDDASLGVCQQNHLENKFNFDRINIP